MRWLGNMTVGLALWLGTATNAAEIAISCSSLGQEYEICKQGVDAWAKQTGHTVKIVSTPNSATERLALYQQLLAAGAGDIDVFQIDVVWPGILGRHFVDLGPKAGGQSSSISRRSSQNNTVDGKLVAHAVVRRCGPPLLPQGPAREIRPPAARRPGRISPRRRASSRRASARPGSGEFWGFVWQGRAYEGLTTNALEWVASLWRRHDRRREGRDHDQQPEGGAGPEGRRRLDRQDHARRACSTTPRRRRAASSRPATRSSCATGPTPGRSRRAPTARSRARSASCRCRRAGRTARNAATLGGQQLAVSKYSKNPEVAADLVLYLTGAEEQKRRADRGLVQPDDPGAVQGSRRSRRPPRSSASSRGCSRTPSPARPTVTGDDYNKVSSEFFNAVHQVLSGRAQPERALAGLDARPEADQARRLEVSAERLPWLRRPAADRPGAGAAAVSR